MSHTAAIAGQSTLLAEKTAVLTVVCPRCGARPYTSCRSVGKTGQERVRFPHAERTKVAHKKTLRVSIVDVEVFRLACNDCGGPENSAYYELKGKVDDFILKLRKESR